MATNTKMLELTFNVEGGRSMILSIPSPKEDLTLATVKEKAALIIPVLESSLRRSRHFAEKCEDRRNQRYRAGIGIRSDWYTAFGHRRFVT